MNTILVITQPCMNNDLEVNYELIYRAHKLSSLKNNTIVIVLVMELYSDELIQAYCQYGGENYLIHQVEQLMGYTYYSEVVVHACKRYEPELVLFPGTDLGKAIAASAAISMEAALIADCINIQILTDKKYCFSRAAMDSSIIAQIRCIDNCIQMCTVKRNVLKIEKVSHWKQPNIMYDTFDIVDTNNYSFEHLSSIRDDEIKKTNIEHSKIIFAVGRGVLIQDIPKIEELAAFYHADIGCSRIFVEEGIMDKSRQIGQSGKSVRPELYIAFGISGASQHMVGIKNAKNIIAINRNPDASICNYSDYVIIADTHDIIDSMYSKVIGD